MYPFGLVLAAGLGFLFFGLVFRPLEVVSPARPAQGFFRHGWTTDLCFFLGQNLVWGDLVIWGLSHFRAALDGIVPIDFRRVVALQPWWLQATEVMLVSDLLIYWGASALIVVPIMNLHASG